jgi:transcription elongation factor Elf1
VSNQIACGVVDRRVADAKNVIQSLDIRSAEKFPESDFPRFQRLVCACIQEASEALWASLILKIDEKYRMNCSNCGSLNCRAFELIHQAGSFNASVADVIGTVRSQTDLARRCSPPRNYFQTIGIGLSLVTGLMALPVGCMSSTMNGTHFPTNVGIGIAAMLVTAVALIVATKAILHLMGFTSRYQRRLHQWSNTFMCLDCGNVMVL